MTTVDGLTKDRMLAIEGASVVSGAVDSGTGHLILTTHDGTVIDAGYVWGTVVDATNAVKGIIMIAGNTDIATGTETSKAVTPKQVHDALIASAQPLDTDLTVIAGLTPAANDIIQYKSGAWANRTMPQLKTDLALVITDVVSGALGGNGSYLRSNGSSVAWSFMTFSDLATSLQNTINQKTNGFNYSGGVYNAATTSPGVYVGPTDPGAVPEGSIWYQTAS